jgi:hypothetical protein
MAQTSYELLIESRVRRLWLLGAILRAAQVLPSAVIKRLAGVIIGLIRVDYRVLPSGKWEPIDCKLSIDWAEAE